MLTLITYFFMLKFKVCPCQDIPSKNTLIEVNFKLKLNLIYFYESLH
jgi:hypothetical protein